MQRAVPRNPPPTPEAGLGHVDAAVTCLWVLTPLAATVSIVIVIVAILTNQWLHTDEKMNNPAYNGTGEKDYLSKLTVSGLWTLCHTNPGELHYDCNNIEYFSKEEYSPDPNDSTMAIPYAVTRSMIFILVATVLLCGGYCCCLLGHCARHRRLCTFVSGVFFIVSGLVMLFGLVMYISVFKAEVGSKLRARSQLQGARFTYRYGYSFIMYVCGFMSTELAGISAIFLFIYRQQRDWHRKQLEDIRRGKRAGHSHGHAPTVNYLHVADHMLHHHSGLFYPPCRRHPQAYINSNSSAIQLPLRYPSPPAHQKRYYFNKEPLNESPCSIHRNRSSNSLKEAFYEFPPPPSISYTFEHLERIPRDVTTNTVSTTADVNCEEFPVPEFDDYSPSIQHEHEFVTFDLDAPLPLRAQSSVSISSRGRKEDTLRRTTPV